MLHCCKPGADKIFEWSLHVLCPSRIVDNPKEARRKGSAARERMVERYTLEVIAREVAEQLDRVADALAYVGNEHHQGGVPRFEL